MSQLLGFVATPKTIRHAKVRETTEKIEWYIIVVIDGFQAHVGDPIKDCGPARNIVDIDIPKPVGRWGVQHSQVKIIITCHETIGYHQCHTCGSGTVKWVQ
jgi:hypothetical protein